MKTHRSRTAILSALSIATFGSLAPRPVQAGLFSIKPAQERKMGEQAAKSIEAGSRVVTGPVADWVERVGQKLARASDKEFEYSFRVLDSPEINAFALPSGFIYVNTGLSKIARNDDELAAVLAHEITHAEQHHYAKQYAKASKRGALLTIATLAVGMPSLAQNALGLVDFALTQKYSRVHEDESDTAGMQRMVRAGFDPRGMVSLLERLDRQDGDQKSVDKWFASHPDGAARVRRAQTMLASLRPAMASAVSPAAVAVAASTEVQK